MDWYSELVIIYKGEIEKGSLSFRYQMGLNKAIKNSSFDSIKLLKTKYSYLHIIGVSFNKE